MALQSIRKSPLRITKFAGALMAITAFLLQPLVALNIPSAFAVSASSSDVWITAAMPDPTAFTDTNGEYIVLQNQTGSSVDMSGWKLDDGGVASLTLSGSVAASDTYKVCRTAATYVDCDQEWTGMSLTNTGDTITLVNGSNSRVDRVSYTSGEVTPGAETTFGTHYDPMSVTVCGTGCDYTALQDAVDAVADGGTVTLNGDVTTSSEVTVTRAVTLNGNGHTLSPNFTKSSSDNNAAIGVIGVSGVTIHNLTIDGTSGTTLHGVNLYEASNAQLNSLTIHDNDRYGVVVNSSDATIDSITTSGNGWGGINVDMVTMAASVTMTGTNSHDEFNALFVEGSGASMTDSTTSSQYYEYPAGSGVYHTKTSDLGSVVNTTTRKAYDTIQSAINDSATTAGDVITVAAGSYAENVTITKGVTLEGPNVDVNPVTQTRGAEAVITGQVSVYSSDVSFNGFTVTNPSWSGVTIKGLHVYSSTGISNVAVTDNIFTDINNANAKGSYGIMVQGAVSDVTVAENEISNITSAGWAHGIEVTPGGGVTAVPTGVIVTSNSISGVTNASHLDQYDFSVDYSDSATADASQIFFGYNKLSGAVRNTDVDNVFDASYNWWGQATGPTVGQYDGDVVVAPWCDVSDCSSLFSDEEVQLDVSGGQGTTDIPLALSGTSTGGTVRVEIPENTTITSDPAWDGTITPPTVTSYNVPGSGTTTSLAITVGSDDYSLTFDNAVRLVLPEQAGKRVGFQAPGGSFTEITTVCSADDQATMNASLSSSPAGECKMNVGDDLVIWTKHFTTFVAYTVVTTSGGGSGGSTSSSGGSTTSTVTPTNIFGGVFNVTPNQGTKPGNGIKDDSGEILGTNTSPKKNTATVNAKNDAGTIFGLAWYWWLAILAAIGAAWWGLSAWRNRMNDNF